MLILFDHVTPKGIARSLSGHTVTKAKDRGWDKLSNGDLLASAEQAGFDVLVTADKNMRYQQNLEGRRIALVCSALRNPTTARPFGHPRAGTPLTPDGGRGRLQWPVVKLHLEKIAAAVNAATAGSYIEVDLR